jgi:D-glycero-D-manno-heptose 1,7-bisphosphate phosphatase
VSRAAVFLDRDGVINEYVREYVRTVDDFVLQPGAAEAFRLLGRLELPIVVVTNQSGIGRGYTTQEIVDEIHRGLVEEAARQGASIVSVEVCPHRPDEGCRCRKPGPALFERAAAAHHLSWEGSWMVGDSPCDMEAAAVLGLRAVRVRTGRGEEPLPLGVPVEVTTDDFLSACRWIAGER